MFIIFFLSLFLHPIKIREVDERFNMVVAADKLSVSIRMFPPSEGGKPITREYIKEALASAKIKYGIDETEIDILE